MPVYEYECGGGHGRFELRQGFDAEPVAPCPACGQSARRVIQAVGVVFKGSGWYSTDSRGRDTGEGKPSETAPKAEGGQKAEKKEEPAKAATGSEAKSAASKESSTKASVD
ncbi:MAG: hypothetical protein HYY05_01935 [Chloroflexi bacterium]|nr:hypothetical protein [Chloroflexota bacterium]